MSRVRSAGDQSDRDAERRRRAREPQAARVPRGREAFDREKLIRGFQHACEKLPVTLETLEAAAARIEEEIRATGQGEVPTTQLGEMASDELKKINKVAYVRFASVYREFTDVSNFTHEIARLLEDKEAHRNG